MAEACPLRFGVGSRVACNLGHGRWATGTVVALHYREDHWPEGRVAPYQVELDREFGGALIFAPRDMPQVIRAETPGTPSVPRGGGDAAAAARALLAELPAARELPCVASVEDPLLMPVAECDGELMQPASTTGPWLLRALLHGHEGSIYRGPFGVRIKCNAEWPRSPPEVRFSGTIRHPFVEDEGLVEPSALEEATKLVALPGHGADASDVGGIVGAVAGAGELPQVLRATFRALHLLLASPEHWPAGLRDLCDDGDLPERHAQGERVWIIQEYAPTRRHHRIFDVSQGWDTRWFDPAFVQAASSPSAEVWRQLVTEEAWEVYSFPLFAPGFCQMLMDEVDGFNCSGLPAGRPNSMNKYGLVINEIGLEPMLSLLQDRFLQPLAHTLFPGVGSLLDSHHSFVVRYKVGEDLGLDMHCDDSDVTFNVCLGRDFDGAGLRFCGNQGAPNHRHASHLYFHKVGRCVVHKGIRRHGADDITRGERLNLIVWNRNSEFRRSREYARHNFQARETGYQPEAGPPDRVCVSFTHDRDYGLFGRYTDKTARHRGSGWCPPAHAEYEGFRPESLGAAPAEALAA